MYHILNEKEFNRLSQLAESSKTQVEEYGRLPWYKKLKYKFAW